MVHDSSSFTVVGSGQHRLRENRSSHLCATILGLCIVLVATTASAQARLTIINQSQRQMTVKVMKASGDRDLLHTTIEIGASGSQTVYFSQTGDYFTKTMAVLGGRTPVYQKGQPFRVYVGSDGYSILTITFTIVESAVPQVTGGREISREEFERNASER